MSALDSAVLVLNSGWAAVHIAPVRRAISLVYRGLAQIVSSEDFGAYDWSAWLEQSKGSDNGCIRSVSFKFMVPEVIRLNFFGGRQSRKVEPHVGMLAHPYHVLPQPIEAIVISTGNRGGSQVRDDDL